MGYNLYITKAESWAESEDNPITAEEWLEIVERDDELNIYEINGPYFAVWKGTSQYDDSWLDWDRGYIYTKNPDEPIIEKMISLAQKHGAKVQGDDGEIYPGPEQNRYWMK